MNTSNYLHSTTNHPERTTDHHVAIIEPPRCECPDCADSVHYLDPEHRWWCRRHSKQAIFVAIGAEYRYPEIVFSNVGLTHLAGISGREQWYALARACRMRPAALETAIFDILLQLKLIARSEAET